MSDRQEQIFMLERVKMYIAENHIFARSQSAINIINEIIEQLSKTETMVMHRNIPLHLCENSSGYLKQEFAYHIANHIMENGLAEPKPIGINPDQTEQYELEISFIRR